MHIDPLQIIQVTLYSKIINEFANSTHMGTPQFFLLAVVYILFKFLNNDKSKAWLDEIINYSRNKTECYITIPYHKRNLTQQSFGVAKENIHISYSIRFHALNYYLEKHAPENISQMVEILKREFKNVYYDSEVIDYVLLPVQNQKIEISKELGILFEIIVEQDFSEESSDDKKQKKTNINAKNYIYRISKQGKENYPILKKFMDNCVLEFENETINKTQQQIFEFIKSEKDEDDKSRLSYRTTDFISNKHLDKNIFFENKPAFISYIDKFSNKQQHLPDGKSVHELEYEDAGITFKAGILLFGEPGCGKSCTIRGILNRTGRHGVLVRWSNIKTCSDFVGIFRSAINNKKYNLRELCFIFEDFDANKDEVLKKRSDTVGDLQVTKEVQDYENPPNAIEEIVKKSNDNQLKSVQDMLQTITKSNTDELTLECVLNTIDGIVELHDAMYIFTTNMDINKLDKAFIRPGRIDYMLELKRATASIIREMVEYKYRHSNIDMSRYKDYFKCMRDDKITPAEVQKTYLKYGPENIEECLQELVTLTNQ